jgi:hypothetical protein
MFLRNDYLEPYGTEMRAQRERFVAIEESLHMKSVPFTITPGENDIILPKRAATSSRSIAL